MKTINSYIIEKLRINKDSKNDDYDDKFVFKTKDELFEYISNLCKEEYNFPYEIDNYQVYIYKSEHSKYPYILLSASRDSEMDKNINEIGTLEHDGYYSENRITITIGYKEYCKIRYKDNFDKDGNKIIPNVHNIKYILDTLKNYNE